MNFLTDVPTANKLFIILVLVDRFLKILVLINLQTKINTVAVACVFFEYVVCIYGLHHTIITDQEPCFLE